MQDSRRGDANYSTVTAISGVEVSRSVVTEVHLDDYSVEPADFRHR